VKWAEVNQLIRSKIRVELSEMEMTWTVKEIALHLTGLPQSRAMIEDLEIDEVALEQITDRLNGNEPLPYVIEAVDFYGLRFRIDSRALIPRPETEELVQWVLEDHPTGGRLLDIGTGSGCIAISLSKNGNWEEVVGLDVSKEALDLARMNQELHQAEVTWLDQPIESEPSGTWDVIVSNPPYVLRSDQSEMEERVLNNEPHLALFVDDEDPCYFYRVISHYAKDHLKQGGFIYLEIHESLAEETMHVFKRDGWTEIELRKDMNLKPRMLKVSK
jgi:release factor glutamine methyltransferase